MRELINDSFYELLETYNRCIIDYCLIQDDMPHQGYRSHRDAVLFAMCKVIERGIESELRADIELGEELEDPFPWSLNMERAKAVQIDSASFFYTPNIGEKDYSGNKNYNRELSDAMSGDYIPYWYAFWNTPHGTGYGPDDFCNVNEILFPKGIEQLEIYQWTTDWSNYFDDGHEWWGAACWSVYDRQLNRYVVILASTTD